MDFRMLAQQPVAILIHLGTVIPAFFVGSWLILLSKKGSRAHRTLGTIYLCLMTITATAAIFIKSLNPGHFSWFHLFVLLTFWSVFAAIWRIRSKDVTGHRRAMLGLYFGLVFAGALTFLPGRLMHRLFIGPPRPHVVVASTQHP